MANKSNLTTTCNLAQVNLTIKYNLRALTSMNRAPVKSDEPGTIIF